MPFSFNQTPGEGLNADDTQQKILKELRIMNIILAQMNPGVISVDDLDNLRADPSLINQRLS